jgi:hypothetical protein
VRAERRGFVGPVAISVTFHALIVAVLMLGGRFSWPAPPIPIELQPSTHRSTPATGEERRGDPRAQPKPATRPPGDGHGTGRPKPAAPLPPSTQDLRPYAPADANLVVLLRSDKLRQSPHRLAAEQLLSALPDYGTLLGGTGLSPIDDFEALLVATADPRDVTATFLAARFHDSPKVHAIGDRPLSTGDPRVFRFPSPGLAVLLRPDEALRLDGETDAGAGDPRVRWVKQLAQFDRAASGNGGPAILVTLSDVPSLARLGDGMPTPLALALALTADGSPLVHLQATFASDDEAERMQQEWPSILSRFRTAAVVVGLSGALDELRLKRNGAQLDVEGRIPESDLKRGLALALAFLPHATFDGGIR